MVAESLPVQSPPAIPPFLRNAIVARAHWQAEMVNIWVRRMLRTPEDEIGLPGSFLLELAAVITIADWEFKGLRKFLPEDLPPARQALFALGTRARKGPAEFEGPDAAPLSLRVFQVWWQNFAWEAPELLQADVVLGELDDEQVADLLANFIWQCRHELSSILLT